MINLQIFNSSTICLHFSEGLAAEYISIFHLWNSFLVNTLWSSWLYECCKCVLSQSIKGNTKLHMRVTFQSGALHTYAEGPSLIILLFNLQSRQKSIRRVIFSMMPMQQWQAFNLDTRNYAQKHVLFIQPYTLTDKQELVQCCFFL